MSIVAAIATAVGEAGIGIVRMTGEGSIELADKIFHGGRSLNKAEHRKMLYGKIYDDDRLIDEVLICPMRAPKTYTVEDMVEIYCHGGIVPVTEILNLLLKSGAEIAQPGEFTKRAFLNGRLALSQAESIMDMIGAKTKDAYKLGLNGLGTSLTDKIKSIRENLFYIMGELVATIDFPEEDIEFITYDDLESGLKAISDDLQRILESSKRVKVVREGIKTVIIGQPNVGKSTLMNALLHEERAIVTDIAGTTRDSILEEMSIDGLPLTVVDTAGIRDTDDVVEKIGVDRALEHSETADLIIWILDGSKNIDDADVQIYKRIANKRFIAVLNKTDLESKVSLEELNEKFSSVEFLSASFKNNDGVDLITKKIKELFFGGEIVVGNDIATGNVRHIHEIELAKECIDRAITATADGVYLDCIEVELRTALDALGRISGETVERDLLDQIFARFCIGK